MLQESVAADDIETARWASHRAGYLFLWGTIFTVPTKPDASTRCQTSRTRSPGGNFGGNLPDRIFKCPYKVKR